MKREPGVSDDEWNERLEARKALAETRMRDAGLGFLTLAQIASAAKEWYGSTNRDAQCLAENRLSCGEPHPVHSRGRTG